MYIFVSNNHVDVKINLPDYVDVVQVTVVLCAVRTTETGVLKCTALVLSNYTEKKNEHFHQRMLENSVCQHYSSL